jgi:hypothetical protein
MGVLENPVTSGAHRHAGSYHNDSRVSIHQ